MMLKEDVLRNKRAREAAEAVIQLLGEESNKMGRRFAVKMFRQVFDYVKAELGIKPEGKRPLVPMADEEARKFEGTLLDFGKYRGVDIRTVPLDYLAWFADQPEQEIKKQIRRYLASKRAQDEIAQEGDECDL